MSMDVGLRLPGLAARVDAGREEGLHFGAQVYVSRLRTERHRSDGEVTRERRVEVIADGALGSVGPAESEEPGGGEALAADHLTLWLSATKPLTAVLLATLWEEGKVELDDPIALHVPEFAAGGKEDITLRHALTHTGGFRMLDVGWPKRGWDEVVAKVCAARKEPRWELGKTAGYHQAGSWFLLGEVIRRRLGQPFAEALRERVLEPFGMTDTHVGMSDAVRDRLEPLLVPSFDTDRASEGSESTGRKSRPFPWTKAPWATHPSPAGGGRGPVRDLGRFYEALLAGGAHPDGGARVVTPQTVEALTARHRVGLYDKTFKHVMDWGLGFIPDSKIYGDGVPYAYGAHASPRTWGHSGYRSTTGFADPEHGLVVAIAFNGLPGAGEHGKRMRGVLEALYEDLGLV